MIKFKKMSATAKVVSGVGVAAVAGVAIIPVINAGVKNDKAEVKYYSYQNLFYKTKADAEAARRKFEAMSGLVDAVQGGSEINPNIDLKPLMAEFVSFVSKLFVVKVFQMDSESQTINHFEYDGMTPEQKENLFQKDIEGEIKYGDLTDITSAVKYAEAHKVGSEWMFTPVDNVMLSVLGDGSGEAYSQNEIDYATITRSINKLKANYNDYYKKLITDNFGGISYSLVHGLTHHNDDELEMSDGTGAQKGEGDKSGDEYTQELITKYQQWGTLKTTFKNAKDALDANTATFDPALKQVFKDMVQKIATTGWNNKERYSQDEIDLRDLLAKIASEKARLASSTQSSSALVSDTNIVKGWNWAPTGDQSGYEYEDWQLRLAQEIQDREKLYKLRLPSAPDGATLGKNYAPYGDGSGNKYAPSLFAIKNDFEKTQQTIGDLANAIDTLVNLNTVAALPDGILGADGKHHDAVGLGDGVDHSQSFAAFAELTKLKDALQKAKDQQKAFEDQLKLVTLDTTPGLAGGKQIEYDLITKVIDFSVATSGVNFMQNYDQDQIDLRDLRLKKQYVDEQIAVLLKNGVTPAPDGALANNIKGKGDESGNYYTQAQIDLRDKLKLQHNYEGTMQSSKDHQIRQAKEGGMQSPGNGPHEEQWGLGDDQIYTQAFVDAAQQYSIYTSTISDLQTKLKVITDKYKASSDGKDLIYTTPDGKTLTFTQLHNGYARAGKNTPEVYTDMEAKYTAEMKKLQDLKDELKTITEDQKTHEATIRDAQKRRLLLDINPRQVSRWKTPEAGMNYKKSGDGLGIPYTQEDRDYTNALNALKAAFPKGNPWWTETSSASKTSEDAYAALYNDWQQALKDGTEKHNSAPEGDGTDRTFEDEKFKVYQDFFEKTMQEWHGKDSTRAAKISQDFKTILDYLKKYGTLEPSAGYVLESEHFGHGDTSRSGDASGESYTKISDIWDLVNKAYLQPGSLKSLADAAKAAYDKVAPTRNAGLQSDIDAAQKNLDAYEAALKAYDANPATAAAEHAFNQEDSNYQFLRGQAGMISSLKNVPEAEIRELAKLTIGDNKAGGVFTAEQMAEVSELKGIGARIVAAQKVADEAGQAWADVQSTDHDNYLRYTREDVSEMVVGPNAPAIGIGDDHTYTMDQLSGRDHLTALKLVIKNNMGAATQQQLDDELQKILKLQPASSLGINGDGTKSPFVGDHSNLNWAQWEINELTNVNTINGLISKIGLSAFAPEHAVFGKNYKKVGDGSGNDYKDADADFITNIIPKFNRLQQAADDADKVVAGLIARQKVLQGLNLDPTKSVDPKTHFQTPTGKVYTLEQFNHAKEWVQDTDDAANSLIKKNKLQDDWDKLKQPKLDYISNHKNDKIRWESTITTNKQLLAQSASADVQKLKTDWDNKQNAFDDADGQIKKWWNDHKGEIVKSPTSHNWPGWSISNDYSKFVGASYSPSEGSLRSIYNDLAAAHAKMDGSENKKPVELHPQEDYELRDALNDFVNVPTSLGVQTSVEVATQAFNVLLSMYDNARDNWKSDPTSLAGKGWKKTDPDATSQMKGRDGFTLKVGSAEYSLYKTGYFDFQNKNAAKTADDFQAWIFNYFKFDPSTNAPLTELVNHSKSGNGKDEDFNDNFFSYNGLKIVPDGGIPKAGVVGISNTKLGAAAMKLMDGKHLVMPDTKEVEVGPNTAPTGDGSGLSYTDEEILWFQKAREAKLKNAEIAKQQAVITKIKARSSEPLRVIPDGISATPGAKTHQQPLGDGSGNDYSSDLIADVRDYYVYKKQLEQQQQLLNDLRDKYKASLKPIGAHKWESTDPSETTVINVDASAVKVGLNHQTYWTKEELAYEGANIQNSKITQQIADLQKQMILDPSKAGQTGTGTTEKVKITAATDGAVQGYNAKATGLHNGSTFDKDQIDKRDFLAEFNDILAKINPEIARLEALLQSQGVQAAPDGETLYSTADWHPKAIGDGTGKTYDSQIFTDKTTLEGLIQATSDAQSALDAFKDTIGEPGLKVLQDEHDRGMTDGVNSEVRYSAEEIALRDHMAQFGTASDHLTILGNGGTDFEVSQTLGPGAQVGENTKKVGLGDDQTYTQQQLDLRDLIKKIKGEEALHGITSEADMASVKKFDPQDSSGRSAETTLQISYREFFIGIDLNSAIIGANHKAIGDVSNAFHTDGDVKIYTDFAALQAQELTDEKAAKVLEDKNVKPAPATAVAITQTEVDAAKAAGDTRTITVGGKLAANGDGTGRIYSVAYIKQAEEYVRLQNAYDVADKALKDFVAADPNLIKFFEYKTRNGIAWNPVVGRNWTNDQLEYKKEFDDREALGVGRTMVSLDDDVESLYGTNRGHMGLGSDEDKNYVLYRGSDSDIKDKVLGSDQARIGYVLNPSGSINIDGDAPVLSSLKAVAKYLQSHQELAPKSLIERFALLDNVDQKHDDKDEIVEETVSKDRFRTLLENYEWGDK